MANNIFVKNILKISKEDFLFKQDELAVEEPLEIRLVYGTESNRTLKNISITMRTPGNDLELALGFLYTENIIRNSADLLPESAKSSKMVFLPENVIQVELSYDCNPDIDRLERHFYTSSSCGVCGKSSIESLKTARMPSLEIGKPVFSKELIFGLPELLRHKQDVFEQTGGLHASAIFDKGGNIQFLKEDVGRHNALDKIAGVALLANNLPLSEHILLVSGRASFELVQKAAMMGVPVMAAVGAPSSLAVQLAEEAGITLIGFLRYDRFNVYCGAERIKMQ